MAQACGVQPGVVERLIAEGAVSAGMVVAKLPHTRGKRRHPNTVSRWITKGKGGVKLEGFAGLDGTWWTSWKALARFFAALTPGAAQPPPAAPDPAKVQAAIERLRAMRSRKR